ncbi:MAG: type II secretion system F family protein [Fervidicoccaceae archaeon]
MERELLERAALYAHRMIGSFPLTRDIFSRLPWLNRYLELIDFPLPMEYYVSLSLLISGITFLGIFIFSFLFYFIHLGVPAYFSFLLSFLLSLAVGSAAFGISIFAPVLKVREMRSKIEEGALFAIITLSAAALSNPNLFESLIASEKLISSKEIRASFRRIIRRVNSGMDLRDSLSRESELIPSRTMAILYEGLSSISLTGVGLAEYLQGFLEDLLSTMEGKVRNVIDRLGVLIESYIIIALIFPFLLIIMLMMSGSFSGSQLNIYQTVLLFDFGVLPAIFAILILLADMILREVAMD